MEKVILVDEFDNEIGTEEKLRTHESGLLHRAFSIFILNNKGEVLLQQRALSKYHSGGLWTNTCCSHPRPNEDIKTAAERRLKEEMGFSTNLKPTFQFIYHVVFENGLIEHEFDHVLIGEYNGIIEINKNEVDAYRFVTIDTIEAELMQEPELYTAWFRIAFPRLKNWLRLNN